MRNIALVGSSGSGKTSVARILQARANFQSCKSGAVCRQVSQILFGDETRINLNVLTDALKSISEDILIAAALRQADPIRPVLIDSLRYQSDYDFARKEDFFIVRVETSPIACIDRLKSRGQSFNPEVDLLHPSELELKDHPSDFIIDNNGSKENLEAEVGKLLTELGKK